MYLLDIAINVFVHVFSSFVGRYSSVLVKVHGDRMGKGEKKLQLCGPWRVLSEEQGR
jgi:hypothetical protein